MKKKLLSMVLAFCMLLTLFPGGTFYVNAVGGTENLTVTTSDGTTTNYTDFASALSAAQANPGSTLTLLSDASYSSEIDISSKMTLDLNGYTLDKGGTGIRVDYYSIHYGELTITDSSTAKSGIITSSTDTVCSFGRIIINGGTIQTTAAGCYALWCETSYSKVVINGGTFIGTRDDIAFAAGTLTINGGNFTATGLLADAAGVTLKGGTFSHIQAPSGATANSLLADCYQYYVGSTASGTAADGSTRYVTQTVTVGSDWSKAVTYDSASKTYTVHSADGLRWISGVANNTIVLDTFANDPDMPDSTNFENCTVKLGTDIDLSGENWTPIIQFMGTFDGAGHKITNMAVDVSDDHSMIFGGFFDLQLGTAKNLSVSGSVSVTGGSSSSVYAGGIAGDNEGNLYNCAADVNVTATVASGNFGCAGGMTGMADLNDIFNCVSLGKVTVNGDGIAYAGALVGGVVNAALNNCYAAASANPALSAVGMNDSSNLTSIGTFDASGALTATDATTLDYGTTLNNAVKYWINRQGADAVNYVTWTTDAVPTLTTTYAAAYAPQYSDWQEQVDGSYTRTELGTGLTETAEAVVISSDSTEAPCETLEDAIAAAQDQDGSTVKLLTDATTENTVYVDFGTFTIDLNGKTWTSTATGDNNHGLWLCGTSNVTLKDSADGGVFTSSAGDSYSTIFAQFVPVTIESGTYNCTDYGFALLAYGVNAPGQKVTITGGTFKNSQSANSPADFVGSNASISGGTFGNDSGMGVFFNTCQDVSLTGGTYADINVYKSHVGAISDIGGLLGNGCAYNTGSAWVSDVSGTSVSNVSVQAAPVSITAQPAAAALIYGYTTAPTLSVTAVPTDSGKTVSYQWYKDGTQITGATEAQFTVPTGLELGDYNYYCAVTCDGYTLNSNTAAVMVKVEYGSIVNNDYVTSYTYTAGAIATPASANFTTNSGAAVSFTWYKGDSTADADKLTTEPSEVGTYTLKADVAETDYYTSASTAVTVTISYLETDAAAVLDGAQGDNGWFYSDVGVFAPDGYQISSSAISWGSLLEIEDPSYDGPYTYYLKQISTGCITAAKTVTVKIDGTAPTIGTLTYSEHQSFLDWIFHKSSIEVTVPVTDDTSGADSISYVLTPDGGTAQAEQTASVTDGNATFTVSGTFKGTIDITAYDKAGNASTTVTTSKMAVENTAPTVTVTDGTNDFTSNWYAMAQTVHISAADAGSGLKSVTYTVDNGSAQTLFEESGSDSGLTNSKDFTLPTQSDGTHTYIITATDNALNTTTQTVTVKQDTVKPVTGDISYSEHQSFLDWIFHKSSIEVTVPVTDDNSGADSISYVLTPDGGTEQEAQTASVTDGNATFIVSNTFKGTIDITAYDKAGNASTTVTTSKMAVENTAPTVTVTDGANSFTDNWYTTAQTLRISAADAGSGLKSVTYTVDNGSAQTLFEESGSDSGLTNSKDFTLPTQSDGTHTYIITATDNALNITTQTVTVKQDTVKPVTGDITYSEHQSFLDWLFHNSEITVTVPVTDDNSGADSISYVLTPDGGTAQAAQTASVTDGNATFTVSGTFKGTINITAYDKAGNASTAVATSKMAVEDTAPTVTVNDGTNAFTNNCYTTAQTLHISASDAGSGLKSITYTLDGGDSNTLFEEANTDSGLTNSKDFTLPTQSDGTHTYIITATDNALNTTTQTVTVKQDTVAPTLSDAAVPTGAKLTDTMAAVTFSASESGSFYYVLQKSGDAPTVDALLETAAHSMTADDQNTVSLTGLEANTDYTLYIAAKDAAGNKTAQVTAVSFKTDKTSIAEASVTLDRTSFAGNGQSQTPGVTVKLGNKTLAAGKDYTISYTNSNGGANNTKDAGTVTVTVIAADGGDYSGVAASKPTYTINAVTEITNVLESNDGITYKLELEHGISDVPVDLKENNALDTLAKIEAQMRVSVEKALNGVNTANIEVNNLTLQFSTDGGQTWQTATDDNFPEDGITVILPYPAGTNKDDFDFVVIHMFTTGEKSGTTETITPEKTANGLKFKLYSLSPVAVGYKAADVSSATEDSSTTENNAATGDTGSEIPFIPVMAAMIGCGSAFLVIRRKRQKQ